MREIIIDIAVCAIIALILILSDYYGINHKDNDKIIDSDGKVSVWFDKSGNGNDLRQNNVGNMPFYNDTNVVCFYK